MSQYKVPQNVEAEDKIIGPLTLKQFIYALIGIAWGGISFAILRTVPAIFIIVAGPVVLLFMLLAFYTRDGQNFEQLLIAMVGFFSQSRKRLWTKEEVVESFHIEPTAVVAEQTQRDPTEVRGELEKLAGLIDSRGWNHPPEQDSSLIKPAAPTERLVQPPAPAAATEAPATDMLDLQKSPLALNLAQLINDATADVRTEAIHQMTAQPVPSVPAPPPPLSTSVTTQGANDILKLATERDDLTVSQLAATATRIVPLTEGQSVELRNNASTSK